jgi:hypothetical protein
MEAANHGARLSLSRSPPRAWAENRTGRKPQTILSLISRYSVAGVSSAVSLVNSRRPPNSFAGARLFWSNNGIRALAKEEIPWLARKGTRPAQTFNMKEYACEE